MKLSIIIPVFNEEKFIKEIIERVFGAPIKDEKEIIVINDGSTDNTKNILENLINNYNFKLINHEHNLGKGSAIKTGLSIVTGDLIIIQDADLEYDPKDIPLLLSQMSKNISAVYGKRGLKNWSRLHYALGAKLLTILINILFHANLHDTYTCYKLFNLNKISLGLLKNLTSSGFEFEAEITCKILKSGGKISETPIHYFPRSKKEGKHIGFKDFIKGFVIIIKCRFH